MFVGVSVKESFMFPLTPAFWVRVTSVGTDVDVVRVVCIDPVVRDVVFEAVLYDPLWGTDETLCSCEEDEMPVDRVVSTVDPSVGNVSGRTDECPVGVLTEALVKDGLSVMGGVELGRLVLFTVGDVVPGCLVVSPKCVIEVDGTYVDEEVAAEVKPCGLTVCAGVDVVVCATAMDSVAISVLVCTAVVTDSVVCVGMDFPSLTKGVPCITDV